MKSSPHDRWPWTMVVVMAGVACLIVVLAMEVFSVARTSFEGVDVLGECRERTASTVEDCGP